MDGSHPTINIVAHGKIIDEENDDNIGAFQCVMKLKSEEYCGRRFKSLKALDKHMMTSEQHEKTISPSPQNCVKSNQCPWCERTFKNKNAAQAHVYRASRDGECQGQKLKDKNLLMRGKKVMSDDSYCCKKCQI